MKNRINLFYFRIALVLGIIFISCSGTMFGASPADPNPIIQLVDAIKIIKSKAEKDLNSLELLDEQLSTITPAHCEMNETVFAEDEIYIIILNFKLAIATSFRHVNKTKQYLKQMEEFLKTHEIDYDDLTVRFKKVTGIELDIKHSVQIDRLFAYTTVKEITDEHIAEIQDLMKKKEKGSEAYYECKELLGIAFVTSGRIEMAITPLEECLQYLISEAEKDKTNKAKRIKVAFCATNLQSCYFALNQPSKADMYKKIASDYNQDIGLNTLNISQALAELAGILDVEAFNKDELNSFLELKKRIIDYSTSDIQSYLGYTISALIEFKNSEYFSPDSILLDIEKAFLFHDLAWSETNQNAMQNLEDTLLEMKDVMLQMLASTKQYEKLNYWTAKTERKAQRDSFLKTTFESLEFSDASSLANQFSKFEDANQIILLEESKKPEERDKKLLQRARQIKQELEEDFDKTTKQLNTKDLESFQVILSDKFIIDPGFLGQLSSILPDDVAYVQYILLNDCILTYVTFHNAPPFSFILSYNSFGESQRTFRNRLIRIRTLLQDPNQKDVIQNEMQWLYNVLFLKLEDQLTLRDIKRIVVNQSGYLRYIPFAALYNNGHYLIEKYQITSITGMDMIRIAKEMKPRSISNLSISVFADPDGTLPSARNEGKRIADLFENKSIYIGEKASIDEFQSLVGNINFVHLATHAALDSGNPSKSYILFANGEKWYYSDMLGFNIQDVDSIVLSGCSTAMTEKSTGGEIEGMAYQLLRKSPSGSILASLWKVDDSATSSLMFNYYNHITKNVQKKHILDRGGALREAQLSLLNNKETSAPFYWAAFTLFGDFR